MAVEQTREAGKEKDRKRKGVKLKKERERGKA